MKLFTVADDGFKYPSGLPSLKSTERWMEVTTLRQHGRSFLKVLDLDSSTVQQLSLLDYDLSPDAVHPSDPHVAPSDRLRLSTQNQKIAARLRRGPATNMELLKIASRFGARVKDLRAAGYVIETQSFGGGLYVYTLTREPE